VRASHRLKDNEAMRGVRFVIDEKGRRVAVLIDLKIHGAIWEKAWADLVSRQNEKAIPYERYRASRLKRTRPRA